MNILLEILLSSWEVFRETAVYMLLGFTMAGLLYVFVKPETVSRHLGKGKIKPVVLSALAGIPIPLCSCGVVPAAAGLKKQGANNGATLSFLISTPESGVDSIPVTYALLDPLMTVLRPVSAFVTAMVAGVVENYFGRPEKESKVPEERCAGRGCCGPGNDACAVTDLSAPPLIRRVGNGLDYAFTELLGDIGGWFLFGIFLAGLISTFVPHDFADSYLGNRFVAMGAMLLLGIPMYVCATSSTPIAAALVMKGLSPGAALVFLLAGPATNAATLSMVSGLLGRRSLLIYLSSIAGCSLLLGFLTDLLYYALGISAVASAGQGRELLPAGIELSGALLLAFLLVRAFFTQRGRNSCPGNGRTRIIQKPA